MIDENELNEILNDPIFELSETEKELFSLQKALKAKDLREKTEYVAQRKPCENFNEYEYLFKQVHKDLREGKRALIRYSEKALKEGCFYIVGGIMVYLDKISELEKNSQNTKHKDGRTRVIYENGTESDIKFRTLGKNIYTDGYVITESKDSDSASLEQAFQITNADEQTGWIYILRSLSTHSEIANQKDLYKIGFSTTPVSERIKNCEYEPTYLMDKVEIVDSFSTYNLKTQNLEGLVHQFFSAARFNIKVIDRAGQEYRPQEWFVVPLSIIKSVIDHILDRTIISYRYNVQLQLLEEVEAKKERYTTNKVDTEGWAILSLIIKEIYFQEILSGKKTIEYRELKQSKINTYTWIEKETGIRYLKKYDALRLYVGYHADRDSALVEVVDITYNSEIKLLEYHLGKVLEIDLKKKL